MTFVKTIQKEEAQSPLKELYQEIEDTIAFKKVPNAFISSSIDPVITSGVWQVVKSILLRDSSIDMSLKEAIALVAIFLQVFFNSVHEIFHNHFGGETIT